MAPMFVCMGEKTKIFLFFHYPKGLRPTNS
jgi:hypothetical protein